jgi:hypothetical protein
MNLGAARLATEKAVFRPALPLSVLPAFTGGHMATKYWEKLKDPRWQRKRLEKLEAAHWACDSCGDGEATLHVHHKQYFKGREPWEYELTQLSVLCESCHESEHDSEDYLLLAASHVPMDGPLGRDSVASLVAGFCGHAMDAEYVADPDNYLLGQFARVFPDGWSFALGGLGPTEMLALIEAVQKYPKGFTDALRTFAQLPPVSPAKTFEGDPL